MKYKVINKKNTYIDSSVKIGNGCVIYPNVYLRGNTVIGDNCVIDVNCVITDSIIESNNKIFNSVISNSKIGSNNVIGPFSHIHSDSDISSNNIIGNYVEIKHSIIKSNIKIKHLSYIGDCFIDNLSNIGGGTIIANCNGLNCHKEKTVINKKCFIGANSVLIAPVNIGSNSTVGAGSVIDKNVSDNSLAIARNRQTNIKNYYKEKIDEC